MNDLTQRALDNLKANREKETRMNYLIAAAAGIILGTMLALAI